MDKKIAIVQSNYIPWKGYFDIINLVDEFILLDDVQYTRRNWRNRNKIKTSSGSKWLSIPVIVKGKYLQPIKDTKISNSQWNQNHWKIIIQNYSKAKYFRDYKDVFEELYLKVNDIFLSDINYRFLSAICNILDIKTKISWSMDYNTLKRKTERLIDLCKQSRATDYISGPTAKSYLEENLFRQEGIALHYMDYSGYRDIINFTRHLIILSASSISFLTKALTLKNI